MSPPEMWESHVGKAMWGKPFALGVNKISGVYQLEVAAPHVDYTNEFLFLHSS